MKRISSGSCMLFQAGRVKNALSRSQVVHGSLQAMSIAYGPLLLLSATFITIRIAVTCERRVGFSRGVIVVERNKSSLVALIAFTWSGSVLALVAVLGPHISNSGDILVLLKERSL
jgi:hypothetical protein